MNDSESKLKDAIRATPLPDRLIQAAAMVAKMTKERRPTRISIPPQPEDEDLFICLALKDALAAVSRSEGAEAIIRDRIKQHSENLAGWREGEACRCFDHFESGPYRGQARSPRPTCATCKGSGRVNRGFLVPTEPDPDERAKIRFGLQCAIDELNQVLTRILCNSLPVVGFVPAKPGADRTIMINHPSGREVLIDDPGAEKKHDA